ncbi:MAG: 30S ribosome-binding factor RbfA [Pseudomonadota bacterium]
MPREFYRSQRVGQALHRALAERLAKEHKVEILRDVTVTHVEVSRDLGVAKVYVTVMDESSRDVILAELTAHAGVLRRDAAKKMRLRSMPQLRFIYDESIERGERLTALIEQVRQKDRTDSEDSHDSDD